MAPEHRCGWMLRSRELRRGPSAASIPHRSHRPSSASTSRWWWPGQGTDPPGQKKVKQEINNHSQLLFICFSKLAHFQFTRWYHTLTTKLAPNPAPPLLLARSLKLAELLPGLRPFCTEAQTRRQADTELWPGDRPGSPPSGGLEVGRSLWPGAAQGGNQRSREGWWGCWGSYSAELLGGSEQGVPDLPSLCQSVLYRIIES